MVLLTITFNIKTKNLNIKFSPHDAYTHYQNIGKPKKIKSVFGGNKPKGLSMLAKIGYGHLCMRED